MTIGGSIALILVGAILTFAVEVDPQAVDLDAMGIILMIGGAVGLVFGLVGVDDGGTRIVRRVSGPDRGVRREELER